MEHMVGITGAPSFDPVDSVDLVSDSPPVRPTAPPVLVPYSDTSDEEEAPVNVPEKILSPAPVRKSSSPIKAIDNPPDLLAQIGSPADSHGSGYQPDEPLGDWI